jgi:hypothetical protein
MFPVIQNQHGTNDNGQNEGSINHKFLEQQLELLS